MTQRKSSPLNIVLQGMGLAVGAWLLYSRFGINHDLPLPPALEGAERIRFRSATAGFLSYYAAPAASGRPLILIHSINAAASAYEMRPIFARYQGTRPVYALDLPGFGFSERANRTYSPELYAQAILDFMDHAGVGEGGADVVALSLGSEFAARAAWARPDLFHSLALISPSGMYRRESRGASQRAEGDGWSDGARATLGFPLWSGAFYDLLVTRASIRFFLQQSFVGDPDPGLVDYCVLTGHQPGARFAPIYFVSGKLFTPDVLESFYSHLTLPALVIYDRDAFVRFDALPELISSHENWTLARIAPSLGLPQFERMEDVGVALDQFWA